MTDLIKILSQLVDSEGKIDIPNISKRIIVFTSKEQKELEGINFDLVFLFYI